MRDVYKKIAVVLYALLSAIDVNVIGQLRLNEVIVLMAAPFVFRQTDLREYLS